MFQHKLTRIIRIIALSPEVRGIAEEEAGGFVSPLKHDPIIAVRDGASPLPVAGGAGQVRHCRVRVSVYLGEGML